MFLYRAAVTLTRKQPYVDWANADGEKDGVSFPVEDRRTVYLVPVADSNLDAAKLIDEFWPDIFEEELSAWMLDEATWPDPRTRELFDAWFDLEFTDAVVDLVPNEPLREDEVAAADAEYTFGHCGWCDLELAPSEGHMIAFAVEDRRALSGREGALVLPTPGGGFVSGIVSTAESPAAKAGEDLLFRACSSRCAKLIRKHVPRALRRLEAD